MDNHQDEEPEVCGKRDSDGCCSCILPENHDSSCVYI